MAKQRRNRKARETKLFLHPGDYTPRPSPQLRQFAFSAGAKSENGAGMGELWASTRQKKSLNPLQIKALWWSF